MQQHAGEIGELPLDVIAVTFQPLEVARDYVAETGWPWPMIVDTRRSLYQCYAMNRGGLWAVWGPRSWWGFARLIFKGRRLRKPAGDVYQMGGDVLLEPDGTIRMNHVSSTPVDRPSVEEILELVQRDPT